MKSECLAHLTAAGISYNDAVALRRIAMTLHRWHELECGDGIGHIERDEKTERPFYCNDSARYVDPRDPRRRRPCLDREFGALKRLNAIMARYTDLRAYVQGDPRGAALYILRPDDAPIGEVDSYYNRGIAIYK